MSVKKRYYGYTPRPQPAPWKQWGSEIDAASIKQLVNASMLPVSLRGALMPDAHVGYGLPIGGVLATDNAVIPWAVGMDIACRMRLSVIDLPVKELYHNRDRFKGALRRQTAFGVGSEFKAGRRRKHAVMDEDWGVSPVTREHKDKGWRQLGSSGSGNHFAEFGLCTIDKPELGLEPGQYIALLSHSGSRGVGGMVAKYYSKLAMKLHPNLPKELIHLAWFDMDSNEGQEYWKTMELMGKYSSANHRLIHKHVIADLGAEVLAEVENHHNFAWKETHFGREMIVHRKGATPAHKDVLGVIPGSMATPGFVVRGLGNPQSLNSAAHGAGRVMSRKQAKRTFNWAQGRKVLSDKGVELMQAGLDELPMVYKDINSVMKAQSDLVHTIARFDPILVRMAGGHERPED